MKLIWKPAARLDRYAIFDFIEADDVQAAINLDELFEARAALLAETPHLGRAGRLKGTRELVVHPNYLIIYRIISDGEIVEILRIKHAAQRWP